MSEVPRRRRLLIGGLALLVSLLLTALFAEILVRTLVPRATFWPVGNIYEPVDLPGIGYTYRPGLSGTAFGVGLEINRAGFRGSEWSEQKAREDLLRVALLGDSFAFGYGVEFEDTVGEQLERMLGRREGLEAEVLGFGVNGYNSRQQNALLRQVVLDYEPDLVILMVTNNDHDPPLLVDRDGWLHWRDAGGRRGRVVDRSIERTRIESPGWLTRHSRLVFYLRVLALRASLTESGGESGGPEATGDWAAAVHAGPPSERLRETVYPGLIAMIESLKKRNIEVVIAHFCGTTDYRRMLAQVERDRDVTVLSLPSLFPEVRSWPEFVARFSLGWDSHPNAEAHRRFAEGLSEAVAASYGPLGES